MSTLRAWCLRVTGLFDRERKDRELAEELESHLQMHIEDNLRAGMSPVEARRDALIKLGGFEQTKEKCRDGRGIPFLESLWQDLRFGARMLRKTPGFTAVAVLTLALGIGANTAMFSVADAILLRSVPYANSDRLVWAWGNIKGSSQAAVSPGDFLDYRTGNHSFEQFSAFRQELANFNASGITEQIQGGMVSAGFFETLGAKALLGRTFSTADERVTVPETVVLSYGFWQRKFGADSAAIGRTVTIEGGQETIIGVMPASFDFYPLPVDVWYPTPLLNPGMQGRPSHFLRVIGSLRSGITQAQAQGDLDAIASRLAEQYPAADKGWSLQLQPLSDEIVGPIGEPLAVLSGAVAFILLIACVNVANLFLSRNNVRQREIAIRAALGASRARLTAQLLTESILLGLAGGAIGLALAACGTYLLHVFKPVDMPHFAAARLTGVVFVFTLLLSLSSGVLFGLIPALMAGKTAAKEVLKDGGRSSGNKGRLHIQSVLVVCEVTLSMALLIGAGLMLNSLWRMIHIQPGFGMSGVLTTEVRLPAITYAEDSRRFAFFRDLMVKIRTMPGVQAAGGIDLLPLSGKENDDYITTAPTPPKVLADASVVYTLTIAGEYFKAMRIPVLRGRVFSDDDQPGSPLVAIINEPFIRRFFPDGNALGKHILLYGGPKGFLNEEIIGVVGGTRNSALQIPPRSILYSPLSQGPGSSMTIVVRSAGDPESLSSGIRAVVASADPDASVSSFKTMEEIASNSVGLARFYAFLLGLFGAVALALAAAGIYGVISYAVVQRTRDIGIRLALGARRNTVLRVVIFQGLRLVVTGLVLGLVLAVTLSHLIASQLYGIKTTDPLTIAAAICVVGFVSLVACYIPARRATKIDPMVALRYE